jgi:hypothetical protein
MKLSLRNGLYYMKGLKALILNGICNTKEAYRKKVVVPNEITYEGEEPTTRKNSYKEIRYFMT